jgi:hypothetical protein
LKLEIVNSQFHLVSNFDAAFFDFFIPLLFGDHSAVWIFDTLDSASISASGLKALLKRW